MKILESELALSLARVDVLKVIGDVRVPQKNVKKNRRQKKMHKILLSLKIKQNLRQH
ncbi:hypothetical protein CRYPA_1016 [uncultured Candidatus Thioglobus sp.]|nr:hypothetical protein CRYPA_1016 [uncultured Candidatus Thioglobus sp.]